MLSFDKHRGMALVTGLIFMVVLTLIVVASMRTTILEEKMAGNARDEDIAFQAAEAALRAAEQVLNGATLPGFAATGAYLTAGSRTDAYWRKTHNWTANSTAYSGTISGASSAPRFVIEEMPAQAASGSTSLKFAPLSESGIYKVTARGVGGNPNTVVYLQSTYRR